MVILPIQYGNTSMKVFYSLCILVFLFYSIFWFNCKHTIVVLILDKVRWIFWYTGLWHAWNMFSTPYHNNKTIFMRVKYENGEEDHSILYDPEVGDFLGQKITHYEAKFLDSFCLDTNNSNIRKFFSDYLVNILSKENNKVKEIEYTIEYEDIIKPGDPQVYSSRSEVAYSHKV